MRLKCESKVADSRERTDLAIIPSMQLSDKAKFIIFILYSLVFVAFGFLMDSPKKILEGIRLIIIEPDVLITDYVAIGGIGAAFVNAGILMLISLLILYLLKAEMDGISIVAVYLMGGFALFGKNIFNIWLIILGTVLYALYKKEKVKKYIYVGFFGTSLAPIISEIFFALDLPTGAKLIIGVFTGLSIGFILPPLSAHLFHVHKGLNLYNVGFAAGVVGSVYVSVFRSFGFKTYSKLIWSEGNNQVFAIFLSAYFLSMLLLGFVINGRRLTKMRRIFSYSGAAVSDFTRMESFGAAVFNMGLNGFLALGYVLLVKGQLNGPTIGGILTVMCFGAYGKHLRNILPILLGVYIGSVTKTWNINDPHILLAALFGTGLAPIGGKYGWIYGVLAGFINSSVVLYSGLLHGGMNLYNTGFSAGIVAGFMLPIIKAIQRGKETEEESS